MKQMGNPQVKKFGCTKLSCLIGMTLVLIDGCGKGYRLRERGSTAILIPPIRPAALTGSAPGYRTAVSKARSSPANLNGCDIQNELLELQWFGNTAEIRIKSDMYFAAPGDQRPQEGAPRMYLDSVQNIAAFRRDLKDRVVNGCLRSDEFQRIVRTIAERFPLPPEVSNLIRFGGGSSGFLDLTPDLRLKVVMPVHRSDNRKEIVSYQIVYYRITSASTDARVKISFDSASTSESNEAPADQLASAQLPAFPLSFRFYRLVFRTALSSADHLAVILSADDEAALNEATKQFEMKRDPSCETLSISRATCMTFAAAAAVNLGFSVSVNGKQVFVPLRGTLSDALHSGQQFGEIPATLRIRRLFQRRLRTVKFDGGDQDMRGFLLAPGDTITW
jgi:hypothetical protein